MTTRAFATALILASLPVALAIAPDGRPAAAPPPAASHAFLDPETGRLGEPTPAQRRTASAQRAAAAPQASTMYVERRDGMTIVRLPRERRVHVRATLGENGELHVEHGHARHD